MKNKYLIKIILPASETYYEMLIPQQLKIAQVTRMIAEYVKNHDDGEYVPTENAALYRMPDGIALDPNAFVKTAGISTGSALMLV